MITVHGGPSSQPSRSVFWMCLLSDIPFTLVHPNFFDTDPLKMLNPRGQVPIIEDGDFVLFEMAAILIYLSEKYGDGTYLPEAIEERARVHQYLHMHHGLSRCATAKLMAPHVTVPYQEVMKERFSNSEAMDPPARGALTSALEDPEMLANGRKTIKMICGVLEKAFFRDGDTFLVGRRPSVADIACYGELGQLQWAGLFDFDGFEKVKSWLSAMADLPHHDTVHRYNYSLGDILASPNTIENYLTATQAGMDALKEAGVVISEN